MVMCAPRVVCISLKLLKPVETPVNFLRDDMKGDSNGAQQQGDLTDILLDDTRRDIPVLLCGRRRWRVVSEGLEVASKVIVTAAGIVSYAACSDMFGSRVKLIAFVGGTMNTIGLGCLNLASYAKQQATERERAIQTIASHQNCVIPDITQSFGVDES